MLKDCTELELLPICSFAPAKEWHSFHANAQPLNNELSWPSVSLISVQSSETKTNEQQQIEVQPIKEA